MDIHDPNMWTKDFVSAHSNECIHSLWETNELVIRYIQQRNYKAAIVGLDRILNGLLILHNSHCGDFRSELFAFSMIEGTIIAARFKEEPEDKRRETAIALFSDARDYAKNEQARQNMEAVISELSRRTPLSKIAQDYSESDLISMLQDLSSHLKEHESGKNPDGSRNSNSSSSGGCYVASAVYGSYDCPQVWTLRRYRDDILASTWYGRAFIHIYYAVSPVLVKWFGHTSWFRRLWKNRLDQMIETLNARGIENTPYADKQIF